MNDQVATSATPKPVTPRDYVPGWLSVMCLCLSVVFGRMMLQGIAPQVASVAFFASALVGAFVGVMGVLRARHYSKPAWVACSFNLFLLVLWVLHHLPGLPG